MNRIILGSALFLSIYLFPWWVGALIAIVGLFAFDNFYEFLIAGAMYFAIYSPSGPRIISSIVWFPAIILLLFLAIEEIKRSIILYKS